MVMKILHNFSLEIWGETNVSHSYSRAIVRVRVKAIVKVKVKEKKKGEGYIGKLKNLE
mgnify:CR=1 FL=1